MPHAALESIEAVARLEQEFTEHRTLAARMIDAIADFTGSIRFVLLHLAGFLVWFLVNSNLTRWVKPFDPFPFLLLGQVLACEGVLLSTFVLIKQNRMSARSELRNHLHLQIALLTEKELTKVLQALQSMSKHQGLLTVAQDAEVLELSEDTKLERLASELKRKLPAEAE